jgi:uncharacterized protein (TIGR02300 family)
VSKPEWGLKRVCQSCGAKFYDMSRSPIVCPKCGATFDPESLLKTRRPKAPVPAAPVRAAPEPEPAEAEEAAEGEEKEEEEEAVMEDTSELGSEDEDVADVVENTDDEKER